MTQVFFTEKELLLSCRRISVLGSENLIALCTRLKTRICSLPESQVTVMSSPEIWSIFSRDFANSLSSDMTLSVIFLRLIVSHGCI